MFKTKLGLAGGALIAALALQPVAADAQVFGGGGYHGRHGGGYDTYRGDRGGGRGRAYRNGGYGYGNGNGYYRGGRRGYRCDRGTGGTIIGAIAGGLLGDSVAGRGDRTAGALVGAGVGALAGRAIDRNC